jgi:hypothetical protein
MYIYIREQREEREREESEKREEREREREREKVEGLDVSANTYIEYNDKAEFDSRLIVLFKHT